MNDPLFYRKIALGDELDNSIKHIIAGLRELQVSITETSYYSIAFQLLASGFERLLKCALCYGYLHKEERFPTLNEIKDHSISNLLKKFITMFYSTESRPALESDKKFLVEDKFLKQLLDSLSEFGRYARYYNLNVVINDKNQIDIKEIWDRLQTDLVLSRSDLMEKLSTAPDYDAVDREIFIYFTSCFEKFTRAIVRQFTLGDLGEEPKRYLGYYSHFLFLNDDKIGMTNYLNFFESVIKKPVQAGIIKPRKRQKICKKNYKGLWPFKNTDCVYIENRGNHILTIEINNFLYGLNGTAMAHLEIPSPFDAGQAYRGRSLTPFIEAAQKL